MSTPADEASTPTASTRQARTLRSEEAIRTAHPGPVADLLIACRRLIVARFGEVGSLISLAKMIRSGGEKRYAGKTARAISKGLSDNLATRAGQANGPSWEVIDCILRYCVTDEAERAVETERLAALYKAVNGQAPQRGPATVTEDPAEDQEVVAELRADLARAQDDLTRAQAELGRAQADLARAQGEQAETQQKLKQLSEDQATALRAAGRLTTVVTKLERQLTETQQQLAERQLDVVASEGLVTDLRAASVRYRAEIMEARERLARLVSFIESQDPFRNARVTASALPSTAQSIGIALASTTPGPIRAVASYLRIWAELGQKQVTDLVNMTGLSPEVIERTLSGQALPPSPAIALIGQAVSADEEYLMQLYLRATVADEHPVTSAKPTDPSSPAPPQAGPLEVNERIMSDVMDNFEKLLGANPPAPGTRQTTPTPATGTPPSQDAGARPAPGQAQGRANPVAPDDGHDQTTRKQAPPGTEEGYRGRRRRED